MKSRDRKGFTLAELLVVVAIIAVLVAIAIPILTSQLEKSREAADASNIRSQYAQVMTDSLTNGGSVDGSKAYGKISLQQKKNDWQDAELEKNLNSIFNEIQGSPVSGGSAWVEYNESSGKVILRYEGKGNGGNTDSGSSDSFDSKLNSSSTPWSSSIKSITQGNIYSYNGSYYIALTSNDNLDPNAQDPKDGWSQAYYCKLTGKVFSIDDFVQDRNDVNQGDACKVGDAYYIFRDGGNVSGVPNKTPHQWLKMN